VTTTGYQTVPSLAGWPQAAQLLIIVLMVFGSESDSTGGGIKQWRVAVLARMCWWTVRDRVTHRRCVHNDVVERLGRRVSVDAEEREGVLAYALVYLVSIILGTFVFTLCGYSIGDSLFEFTSALGTVGFSAGIATASASPVILWTTIIGMFIGRLEIFPVLIALTRGARLLQGRAK
jgi:trk system potassium uptake protein TrkH